MLAHLAMKIVVMMVFVIRSTFPKPAGGASETIGGEQTPGAYGGVRSIGAMSKSPLATLN